MPKLKFLFAVFFVFASLAGAVPLLCAAENYDIKQMTPAIEQAIGNRQARYQELQSLKLAGKIGEDNQGFVQGLQDLPEVSQVVGAENRDREVIYQAIVDQNQLGAQGMAKVKMVFGEVQRERAQAGESVQLPSGEWVQK